MENKLNECIEELNDSSLSSLSLTNDDYYPVVIPGSFGEITGIADEIYADTVKRSRTILSAKSYRSQPAIEVTIKDAKLNDQVSFRPNSVPTNKSIFPTEITTSEHTNKQTELMKELKESHEDFHSQFDSISNRNRAKSAYLTKERHVQRDSLSAVSKHVCQICGPQSCNLCSQEQNRNMLFERVSQSAIQSRDDSKSTKKPHPISAPNYPSAKCAKNSFDSRILAIILKNRSCLNLPEENIEELLDNEKIYTCNRFSPYDIHKRQKEIKVNINEAAKQGDDINNENEDGKVLKQIKVQLKKFDDEKMVKSVIDTTVSSLKKFKVTDYYFQNMRDLRAKSYFKTEKLFLSKTPVPKSSNKLFADIEKFDIADRYKAPHRVQTEIIKKRDSIDEKIKAEIQEHKNTFERLKFVSSKKFKIMEPPFKQYYEPPLLNVRMQKLSEAYENRETKKIFSAKSMRLLNRNTQKQ